MNLETLSRITSSHTDLASTNHETQQVFSDPNRLIAKDLEHSFTELRYYCLGRVGEGIITVRFTYRGSKNQIIGAGYWRKGKKIYEEENVMYR